MKKWLVYHKATKKAVEIHFSDIQPEVSSGCGVVAIPNDMPFTSKDDVRTLIQTPASQVCMDAEQPQDIIWHDI